MSAPITPPVASDARNPAWIAVGDHRVRLLCDGAEGYPAMLAAIAAAEREICLEMYWFGSDQVGRAFVDALARRARAGVTVRVIYDAMGSRPVDDALFEPLRGAGGDVRAYGPLSALWPKGLRWLRRDHRKILVCDGAVAFTGGINIGLPWARPEDGGQGFRDHAVELHGPVADELRGVFFSTWRRLLRRRERSLPSKMPPDALAHATRKRARKRHRALAAHPTPGAPTGDVWVIASRRRSLSRAIRAQYLRWINTASACIEIVNPYFLPDRGLQRAMIAAVRRGVSVRVLVPEKSDVPLVQWALEHRVARLAAEGVEIWAYRARVLHAKTGVFDRAEVTIGTYNLDAWSFRWNLEVNVAIRSEAFAAEVRRAFEIDRAQADRWTPASLAERPWWRRGLGAFAALFARFL
jgi:cardiolipin synthase